MSEEFTFIEEAPEKEKLAWPISETTYEVWVVRLPESDSDDDSVEILTTHLSPEVSNWCSAFGSFYLTPSDSHIGGFDKITGPGLWKLQMEYACDTWTDYFSGSTEVDDGFVIISAEKV